MQTFILTGDITLLAAALELAVERYTELALDAAGYPSISEQFHRQAAQAEGFLRQAWRILYD